MVDDIESPVLDVGGLLPPDLVVVAAPSASAPERE